MSLSTKAIDRLFRRLTATYGNEFASKWDAVEMSDLKTAWAHELSAFSGNLNAIGWALENLPDRCPNLMQFKTLCKQAPKPDALMLDAPKASADIVDKELAKMAADALAPPVDDDGHVDHKRWAHKLKARHDAGDLLGYQQIKMYKEVLREL